MTEAAAPARRDDRGTAGKKIYRHSIAARTTHWLWTLAMLVLVMSGLQIFNAAPYLDASDKSNPRGAFGIRRAGRLAADRLHDRVRSPIHDDAPFGYTDDGMGAETARAIPGLADAAGA